MKILCLGGRKNGIQCDTVHTYHTIGGTRGLPRLLHSTIPVSTSDPEMTHSRGRLKTGPKTSEQILCSGYGTTKLHDKRLGNQQRATEAGSKCNQIAGQPVYSTQARPTNREKNSFFPRFISFSVNLGVAPFRRYD